MFTSQVSSLKSQVFDTHPRGAAAIVVAIVSGSVALLIAVSAVFLGMGALDAGDVTVRGGSTLAIADACTEETLLRMRRNGGYGVGQGAIPLTIGSGSCTITIEDLGGNRRRITVVATMDGYRSRVQATATVSAFGVTVDSWAEIAAQLPPENPLR